MPLATSSVESGAGQDGSLRALEARVRRKLDLRILPLMSVLYLFNFLDRTSIGNAKIAGLVPDAKLNGTELNTALTVFYVLYMVCQIPSNWVLKKVGANRWLALMACAWSIISIGTGFVQNFGGLVTLRFLLGGFEGTILPGMILYMSMLYPRHELQTRIALFWSPATVAGAFGGLLAAGIIKMDGVGGLAGWRWIFILEGIATFLIGILFWLALPRKLENMTFLTPEERDAVVARLKVDIGAADLTGDDLVLESSNKAIIRTDEKEDVSDRGSDGLAYAETAKDAPYAQEQFEWREVLRGLSDIKVWLVAVSYFGVYVAIFSLAYFIPTLIAGLGYSGSEAQLRTVPPYVVATGVTVIVSYIADRMKMRLPMVLVMLPIAIAGYAIAVVSTDNKVRYGALFLMILGVYPTAPAVLAFVPNNKSGHYCRGTAVALYIGVSSAGGFMSTFVYTPDQAPHYIKGHSIVLGLLCASFAIIGVTLRLYIWENKARAEGRRNDNITKYKALWDAGLTRAPIGDRHPDFRYTL